VDEVERWKIRRALVDDKPERLFETDTSDRLDSGSSPIVDLKWDFTRLVALKDLSLVADDTGIVSKILMMLYIAELKSRFLACSLE
jgi:hypothetical protein